MSIPYFPFYVADYEADTVHLTLEEDGCYVRLLRLCWRTPGCTLPDDDAWIMRRLRMAPEDYARVAKIVLEEFFQRSKGRVFSPRLLSEYEAINATSKKRRDAGRKGGRPAKSLKTNETDESRAEAGPKQPEPEPEPYEDTTSVVSKRAPKAASLVPPEDWSPTEDQRDYAAGQGLSSQQIDVEAESFRDWHQDNRKKRAAKDNFAAAWRTWTKRAAARPPPIPPPREFNGGPRVIKGGRHEPHHDDDRFQRIIATAAAGTSRPGWG